MRPLLIAFATVASLGGFVATSVPAAAYEFPYCLRGKDQGFPGDCTFRTYAECKATASGRFGEWAINPAFAFDHQNYRRYW